jgi:hypothetical protein
MSAPRVHTAFWRKPGPTDAFDWSAWYDTDEPDDYGRMNVGYGATDAEAVLDLIDNHPRGVQCERDAES